MKMINVMTDEAILAEIGQRISSHRVELNMTQAEVAKKAGMSKRTVENIESGASGQMSNIIRIFRVLNLIENLDRLIPEPGLKPMDLLKQKRKTRVRASRKKTEAKGMGKTWKWKEDE
jgi:transcriptional regulator with XRE-family HTH domain